MKKLFILMMILYALQSLAGRFLISQAENIRDHRADQIESVINQAGK